MDKNECEDKYSESETEEHLNGKRDLFEWIRKQNGVTHAVLEGWIPETKQRPDIMFEYNGKKYVIEYQCSPIATEYIKRHELYKASGIIDIWIAGCEKYFKENSRHKFLEDYIEGYYNTSTRKFRPGNTDQGRFIINMSISPYFPLKNFVLKDNSIINKTWVDKKFTDLYTLHKNRLLLRDKFKTNERNKITERVVSIKKYINGFNGKYELNYNYFPYENLNKKSITIHAKNYTDFQSKTFNTEKKGFYKRIYDLKQIIMITQKINQLFDLWNNNLWGFKAYDKEDGIELNVYLFDSDIRNSIHSFAIYQYCDIKIHDEESIKQLLAIHMRECIKKGLEGTDNIRIMEVRDN